MKALVGHLFDAIGAMSLLVVVGMIAMLDEPRNRIPTDTATRDEATTSWVVIAPPPEETETRRDPATSQHVAVTTQEPTHVLPPLVRVARPEPVMVAQQEVTRVGYAPLSDASPGEHPPAREPEPQPQRYVRPYERERVVVQPKCAPGRYEIMQYWRMDLIRARAVADKGSDAQVHRVLGAT
jgi:hypothetical protein